MKRVRFRPRARQDLARAQSRYAEEQPGLDEKLRSHLRALLSRIAAYPQLYVRAPIGDARRAPAIGPFSFSVYYRETEDSIEVLGVLHNARHPEEWQSRVR